MGGRAVRIVTAVGLVVAASAIGAGLVAARADGECRITGGSATLLVREPAEGAAPTYEGAMFVVTRDCGDGPLSISGSFVPVAGSPASCAAVPSTMGTAHTNTNRASCAFTGSAGLSFPGTAVTVTATAEVAGLVKGGEEVTRIGGGKDPSKVEPDPGTGRMTSVCVLTLPEVNGRQTCTLF